MNFIKGKKLSVKILSVFISALIIFSSVVPASATVEYPAGITSEQAYQAIFKTDSVIDYLVKQTQNKTLRELAETELYSDKVLSSILVGIYQAVEENSDSLAVLGLRTSVSDVASYLTSYGDVSAKLGGYSNWSSITDLGATWNVSSKAEFAFAISTMLTPFNDLLYALLCSGSCSVGLAFFLNIKGSNGYETAIIPTLEALGCQSITSPEVFYEHAKENKAYMIYHIAYDVLTLIESVLDAPCDRATDILPSIAYFANNGGLENAVSTLISPLKVQLLGIATLANLETLIADSEEFTQNFAVNFNDILATLGFGLENVDFDLIASCGTVSGNKVIADKPAVFIVLLRWIIDSVKLNETTLNNEVSGMSFMDTLDLSTAFSGVMDKSTDDIISTLINLLTQSQSRYNDYLWQFSGFTQTSVSYTANLDASKIQRVVDGTDELINEILAESDPAMTFEKVMKEGVYSSSILSLITKSVYGIFENEDMEQVLSLLGYNYSPSAVASVLQANGFSTAATSLRSISSWSALDTETFSWGITPGDRTQFVSCLCAAFSPFEEIFRMLLAEGSIKLFDTVDIYGSNGYNTAIIPLLEAVGCPSSSILTYDEFKTAASGGATIRVIINSICDLIDSIASNPVYVLTGIIPNMVYFLDNQLVQCIENLVYPFEDILETFDMENSLGLYYLRDATLSQVICEMLLNNDFGIKLPALNLTQFSGMGTPATAQSKRTYQGQYVNVTYIQSDRTAVMMSLLRYLVDIIKTPGNESLLDSVLQTDMGTNPTVSSFVQNIKTELQIKTTDETVEWIYQLFFKERVTVEITESQEYTPTIIYKEKNNVWKVIITLIIIYVILEVIYFFNRKRIRVLYAQLREKTKNKTRKNQEV